jgi:formylglycine-generating enzyme required for sulfatase activity
MLSLRGPALTTIFSLTALMVASTAAVAQSPVKPGETITNSLGMKLTLIPAGEFGTNVRKRAGELLGKVLEHKPEDIDPELPAHRVRITEPFYLGTYEVTLGQFLMFYHGAGYKCECEKDGKGGWGYVDETFLYIFDVHFEQYPRFVPWSWGFRGQTYSHPVVNVTWNDAAAFCEWLSRKEGKTYRLPTEAEWEYACRAGTQTRYYNGNDPEQVTLVGNVKDATAQSKFANSKASKSADGYEFTAPVGRFKPNAFGLYDMHGNVREWCLDKHEPKHLGQAPANDPQGSDSGPYYMTRGGSWHLPPASCRSGSRFRASPSDRDCDLGFRVAADPGR